MYFTLFPCPLPLFSVPTMVFWLQPDKLWHYRSREEVGSRREEVLPFPDMLVPIAFPNVCGLGDLSTRSPRSLAQDDNVGATDHSFKG